MFKYIQTSFEKNILIATINRPEKLNALNSDVMNDIDILLTEIESNADIKGAIITGSGQKAFVAGADISEFIGLTSAQGMELAKKGQNIFFKIENCLKPFIAAVNGFALGGGCELAMACHFRTASENAKFGQPEVNLGIIPGYGGTQRLVQLIGKGRAMELLMTGDMIDAHMALNYGMVNHVFQPSELLDKTITILENILSKGPFAIGRCIRAVNSAFNATDGYKNEIMAFGECFGTEDMKEGAKAFIEKRKAVFKGF